MIAVKWNTMHQIITLTVQSGEKNPANISTALLTACMYLGIVADLGLVFTNDALRIDFMGLPRRGKVADIIDCVLQREVYKNQG